MTSTRRYSKGNNGKEGRKDIGRKGIQGQDQEEQRGHTFKEEDKQFEEQ
jgi:hypothetical protein